MTDSATPPRLATLLLTFFAAEPDFPQIEGDLNEEFYNRLIERGPRAARRLYWREALRNLWVLSKRSGTIVVLVLAALAVAVFPLTISPLFHWLDTFYFLTGSVFLQLFVVAIFETAIAIVLSVLMSQFLKGREPLLRLAFTAFYLLTNMSLYLFVTWPNFFDLRLSYFTLNITNWSVILIAFWKASVWMSEQKLRRSAG